MAERKSHRYVVRPQGGYRMVLCALVAQSRTQTSHVKFLFKRRRGEVTCRTCVRWTDGCWKGKIEGCC